MKPAPFVYHRPKTLDEAIALLRDADGMGRPLLGGQSLIPMLNLRLAPADTIVDIKSVPELAGARQTDTHIRYGAGMRHAEFEDGLAPDIADGFLAHVASGIAYRAVRNRGTIGGSLCLADTGGDWAPVMTALGAECEIARPDGVRSVPIEAFFLGPYVTALDDADILLGISVPKPSGTLKWGHSRFVRKAGEYASSIAVCLSGQEAESTRVVLGGTGIPLVLEKTAAIVADRPDDTGAIAEAAHAELAERDVDPNMLPVHLAVIKRAIAGALS